MNSTLNNLIKALPRKRFMTAMISGFLLAVSGVPVCASAEVSSIPSETVTGDMTAGNGFLWRYGYDIAMKDGKVIVQVAINLIPAGGVTQPEIDRLKEVWEKGIEHIWSNRFALTTPAGEYYPIVMDVTFAGSRFHHDVIVRPGGGNTDELNWRLMNSPEIAAHEFGHMIGVFDEYRRGAIAPQGEMTDATSIMKGNPGGVSTYARHYEGFRRWFVEKTGLNGVSLTANPMEMGASGYPGKP